jgi:hypothetical protein
MVVLFDVPLPTEQPLQPRHVDEAQKRMRY